VPLGDIGDGSEAGATQTNDDPTVGLYPALTDLQPKQRTQQLAAMLHWDRDLPPSLGVAASLDVCLVRAAGVDRRTLIKSYWLVRERVARYQLATQQMEQLDGLSPTALRTSRAPGGAAAMLRLQRSRLAAHADLATARIELLIAQFSLALNGRWPIDGLWPVPSTAPHGGSYRLGPAGQGGDIGGALTVKRLAARIPTLHSVLMDRAASIVSIDAARAQATSKYESGDVAIDEVLSAIERQVADTSMFLAAQTEYNAEIADYALSVLPLGTSDGRLIESLVLTRPNEADPRSR
jgi:hypothetical protein